MLPPYFIDTTLRDGEQAPGVVFSLQEKIRIAALLDEAGIPELETGTPAIGDEEAANIRTLCHIGFKFKTLSWSRANRNDILLARKAGTDGVHISFPVSPLLMKLMGKNENWVMKNLYELTDFAASRFGYVTVGAQDASRAERPFLKEFVHAVSAFGVSRIRLADTTGLLNPSSTSAMIREIHETVPDLPIEFHAHNDLGMATANTLAAYMAGAECLSVTINGLGERAGNAALEEVALALELSAGVQTGIKTELFGKMCSYVADASGRTLSPDKPVTGSDVLSHESGIHTRCLLRDRSSYQLIPAAKVGRKESDFVLGKHSGKSTVAHILQQENLLYGDDILDMLTFRIKQFSEEKKRAVGKEELYRFYADMLKGNAKVICNSEARAEE